MRKRYEALIKVYRDWAPPFDTLVQTYAWLGERHWPVWINPELVERGDLPWRLIPVGEFDIDRYEQCYIRADAFWTWLPLSFEFWLHNHWRWFYTRVIVTLAIWGLADYDRAKHPSWGDIRFPWRQKT